MLGEHAELKSEHAELKGEHAELKGDFAELKAHVAADEQFNPSPPYSWGAGAVGDDAAADPACGTPVECYAQAIKMLNVAEQKIAPLQIAMVEINKTVQHNTAAVDKNTATIAQNNQLLTNRLARLQQDISTNAGAISTITANLTSISSSVVSNQASIRSISQVTQCLCAHVCVCL